MLRAHLRKVGGSLMLTVPPSIAGFMELRPGSVVGMTVEGDRLIVEAARRRRYSLDTLIAEGDPEAPHDAEDRAWLGDGPRGSELI